LFSSTSELLERCNSSTPDEDDPDALAELISQLERKKTILADLDRHISAAIDEEELEGEVLEAEELQAEISKSIMKGKRLQRRLQTLDTSTFAPHSKTLPTSHDTSKPQATLESVTDTTDQPTETLHPPITSTHSAGTGGPPGTLPHTPPATVHDIHAISPTVRLPRLDLPTFSGNTLEWRSFWDGFDATVNSNSTLTGVQKLTYLRAQLRGDASEVMAGFCLTNDNYTHSMALLQERYGQSQKLVTAHMRALLDLPGTLSSLQSFHDSIEKHVRSLSPLGKSIESYGELLVPALQGKLPPKTHSNNVTVMIGICVTSKRLYAKR